MNVYYGTMASKIVIMGLRKAFGPKQVLDGVDLRVNRGESMVVIGGSGTGKSVLLKCLLGIMQPDSGHILVDGEDMTWPHAKRRDHAAAKFGMLFQGGALFDSLPVWENVAFGLLARKLIHRRDARDLAVEKLALVGLGADVAQLYPADLSGGMQKRVALARAIAPEPEILLFDEPTTGLDPIMASVIDDLIVRCVKRLGATAVTITHDMGSVRRIADRVAMLHRGRIVWQGPVADIDASGNAYVDQFVNGRAEGPIQTAVKVF